MGWRGYNHEINDFKRRSKRLFKGIFSSKPFPQLCRIFFNMGGEVADCRGLYFSFEGVRIIETTVDFFDLLREISSPEEVYKKEDGGKIY